MSSGFAHPGRPGIITFETIGSASQNGARTQQLITHNAPASTIGSSGLSGLRTLNAIRPAGAEAKGNAHENNVATSLEFVGSGSFTGSVTPLAS